MVRTNMGDPGHKEAFHLGKCSTVLQAEILSVEKIATFLLNNKVEGKKILINCDSLSAIMAINSTVIRNKTTHADTYALPHWVSPMK